MVAFAGGGLTGRCATGANVCEISGTERIVGKPTDNGPGSDIWRPYLLGNAIDI